jgi:hypothetical protein
VHTGIVVSVEDFRYRGRYFKHGISQSTKGNQDNLVRTHRREGNEKRSVLVVQWVRGSYPQEGRMKKK